MSFVATRRVGRRVSAVPPATADERAARDETWVRRALDVARGSLSSGDVPVGALVLGPDGAELAAEHNRREALGDPTAHAEVLALRAAAAAVGRWRLDGCTLVVTVEPCAMCAGAIGVARVSRVVFGAWEPRTGAVGSVWDVLRDRRALWRPEVVGGVLAQECAALLTAFFADRRRGLPGWAGPARERDCRGGSAH